jgi:hypothetical protein
MFFQSVRVTVGLGSNDAVTWEDESINKIHYFEGRKEIKKQAYFDKVTRQDLHIDYKTLLEPIFNGYNVGIVTSSASGRSFQGDLLSYFKDSNVSFG